MINTVKNTVNQFLTRNPFNWFVRQTGPAMWGSPVALKQYYLEDLYFNWTMQSLRKPMFSKTLAYALIEDSDQSAHPRSMIRVCDGRSIDSQESTLLQAKT